MDNETSASRRGPVWVGLGMAAVFGVLAIWHPGREQRVLRHVLTWTSVAALLGLFAWGWRFARLAPRSTSRIWVGGAFALSVIVLCVPAFQSSDLYAYAQTGWLQVAYDANPYTTVPSDVGGGAGPWFGAPDDPMFTSTWREVPCVYGFAFAHLTRGPARWSGGEIDRARMWFRVLSALALLAIAWLLWHALVRQNRNPIPTLYLLVWSPFVLLQFISNGHNDLLPGLLILIAMLAASEGRWFPVIPALVLATLTKIVAVVILPFAVVYLWRRHGARAVAWGALAGVGLAVLVSWPYVVEWSDFCLQAIWAEWTRPAHSLTDAVIRGVSALDAPSGEAVAIAMRWVLSGALAVFVSWRVRRATRASRYDSTALLHDSVLALLGLLVLVSAKFHPWYLGMVLPAALLLPEDRRLRQVTIWLSVSWMLVFTGLGKARVLDFLVMTALPLAIFVLFRGRLGPIARSVHRSG